VDSTAGAMAALKVQCRNAVPNSNASTLPPPHPLCSLLSLARAYCRHWGTVRGTRRLSADSAGSAAYRALHCLQYWRSHSVPTDSDCSVGHVCGLW
jgi:hypothetical protein